MKNINQALLALLDLVFALDHEGRFLYIGALTARAFGSDRDHLIGAPLTHANLPPSILQQLMQDYQAVFANERDTSGEIRLPVFYQDATKDYEYTFSPVRGHQGRVEAAVFIAKDITERKRAEIALQESEAKYRALFEAASDIILILDAVTYQVLNANWAAARKLGYSRRELLGLTLRNIEAPFDSRRQSQIVQRLEMDGEIIYEHRYRRKNGSVFPVEINAQLIEYEEQLAIQTFVRDISERKQAEETLRQKQQQIESIAANFPGTIYREVVHPDGRMALPYISEGVTQFTGRTPAELEAEPELLTESIMPSDRPAFDAQLQYCRQTLQSMDVEYRNVNPDGTVSWLREIARFSRAATGDVVTDGVVLDVTDRREAQIALERQLEQERLLRQGIEQIHQSLDLHTILQTTANNVLAHLQAERVFISRYNPNWSTNILAQAARFDDWLIRDPALQASPCLDDHFVEYFQQGEVETTSDIYSGNLSPAMVEYLAQYRVRSHLVVPILVRSPDSLPETNPEDVILWGLLITHQCSEPREWQFDEINLVKQISTQVGIAIYQSELYQNLQNELQERTRAEAEVRALNTELEQRVQERTRELRMINRNLEQEISVRRQTEIALRASEHLYATLAALAPVGIFHTDAAGRCVYVNQRCCEILGFSEEEALSQPWEGRLHPDARQQVIDAWQAAAASRTAYRVECRLAHADGSLGWIIAQGQPEISETGEIIGFVSTITDITALKQAEEALATSEARLRDIMNSAGVTISYARIYGDRTWINEFISRNCVELTGYTQEEITAELWDSRIPPEDYAEAANSAFPAILAGTPITIEYRFLHKAGFIRWISESITSRCSDDGDYWITTLVAIDITDRKQAELELQESEAKHRALLRALPDLVMRINREGVYLDFFATNTFRVMGRAEDLVGSRVEDSLPAPLAQQRMAAMEQALATGQLQIYEQEVLIDGEVQIEEVRVVAYDQDATMVIVRDITERKQAEESLRNLNRELQAIFAALPDLYFRVDWQGMYLDYRCRDEAELLQPPREFLGQNIRTILPPDISHRVQVAIAQAIATNSVITLEYQLEMADGLHSYETRLVRLYEDEVIVIARDITDRKQTERNLALSEERLRTLIDALPLGIWMCDEGDRIILQNREDLTRYGDIRGDRLEDTSFPSEQIARHREIKRTCQLGESVQYEVVESIHGEERTLLRVTGKVPDFSGGIGMFGASIDISDRKRSEEKFRLLFQYLGIGIAILEPPRFALTSTNLVFQNMLGYSAEELASMTCADFSHPDDWTTESTLIQECWAGERDAYQIEKRYIRKDQQEIWVSLTVSMIRNGNGHFRLGICAIEDITLRKRLEQSLQYSQGTLRDILDNVDASIVRFCIFDNGTMVTEFVSAGCKTVFGYAPEELMGDVSLWQSRVIPEDLETIVCPSRQRVQEVGRDTITYRFRHKDGQIREIQARAIAHRDEAQGCYFVTAIETARPLTRN
ncbi:MAG: PAS domain S-box protein [Synechococcales bacterium]|nr:PAS domain S-box protein [Synechococcales bacterium]